MTHRAARQPARRSSRASAARAAADARLTLEQRLGATLAAAQAGSAGGLPGMPRKHGRAPARPQAALRALRLALSLRRRHRAPAQAGRSGVVDRLPRRLELTCRPSSRGESGETTGPSRKVRTPQGRVVGKPTRGNPRESATETHRLSAGPHVSPVPARLKWCGKSAPAAW